MRFDWDADREEAFEGSGGVRKRRRRRWLWLWLLFLFFLAGAGGLALWRQATQRIATAEERVAEAVRASHRLARRAAATNDRELLESLLSSRSEHWQKAQLQALGAGTLSAAAVRPLGLVPQAEAEIGAVRLDPGLDEAVLVSRQRYSFSGTTGISGTVTLAHHYVYRKGVQWWLLSPPLPAFWGDSRQQTGQVLTVTYPQRDEAVAGRLATDLDALLVEFCALAEASCPPDLHLAAELVTDPESVQGLVRLPEPAPAAEKLVLPTPTLVGLPMDETGYAALLRGYAAPLLAQALVRGTAGGRIQASLGFVAVLQKQLVRLGIAPWPLDAAGYEAVLGQSVDADIVATLLLEDDPRLPLSQSGPRWHAMLALVDFLEAELGAARLLAGRGDLYRLWVGEFDRYQFIGPWLDFIYDHSRSGQRRAALQPEGSLQFVCQDSWVDAGRLLAYEFENDAWTRWLDVSPPQAQTVENRWRATVRLLPDGYGYLIRAGTRRGSVYVGFVESDRFEWWPEEGARGAGEAFPIFEWQRDVDEGTYAASSGPTGRYLVLSDLRTPHYQPAAVWLVDLESCLAGGCTRQPLAGEPHWSPDARQTLLVAYPEGEEGTDARQARLYRAGPLGEEPRLVGTGYNPFWLDERRFGYLQVAAGGGEQLLLAGSGSDQGWIIARTTTFLQALAAEARPPALTLVAVQALRADPVELLVWARAGAAGHYLFRLALAAGAPAPEIGLLAASREALEATPSPDGRWLVLHNGEGMAPTLFDLEADSQRALGGQAAFIWSPAGEWLAEAHDHYFLLRTPEADEKVLVTHPLFGCEPARWVQE